MREAGFSVLKQNSSFVGLSLSLGGGMELSRKQCPLIKRALPALCLKTKLILHIRISLHFASLDKNIFLIFPTIQKVKLCWILHRQEWMGNAVNPAGNLCLLGQLILSLSAAANQGQ